MRPSHCQNDVYAKYLFQLIARKLAGGGLIDSARGTGIVDLAWPRFLTMYARDLYRAADLTIFGPAAVAAFEVARRVRGLMRAIGSGFSMATSSVVDQEQGRADEREASRYTRDVIRFSAVVYGTTVVLVGSPGR